MQGITMAGIKIPSEIYEEKNRVSMFLRIKLKLVQHVNVLQKEQQNQWSKEGIHLKYHWWKNVSYVTYIIWTSVKPLTEYPIGDY